jgi:hypothetical protein
MIWKVKIVFVHLNTPIPEYLVRNIQSHLERFPLHEITLISNSTSNFPRLTNLKTYLVRPDHQWSELDSLYLHPKDFRGNFWLTSSARLFALDAYVNEVNEECIHVESDVILADDFPFERLTNLDKGLAFPIMSNERGVGSVIYIRNQNSSKLLISTLISEARKSGAATEMNALKSVFDSNPKSVALLPMGPAVDTVYRNASLEMIKRLSDASESLGGIIDGVEIGQYFFGTDPRNRRGRSLRRQDIANGFLRVGDCSLIFDDNRGFPNLIVSGDTERNQYKVFALHLPSKEVDLFTLSCQKKLMIKRCLESANEAESTLYWPAWRNGTLDAAKRRLRKIVNLQLFRSR